MRSNNQKIAFRVDASAKIGTGHVMRCLTLADALKQHGASCCFISREMPEYLQKAILLKGHEFQALQSPPLQEHSRQLFHSDWLNTSQEVDADDAIKALVGCDWDWIVVDHYALDVCWEERLRGVVKKVLVIDDIADRMHDCDLLLDQNYYTDMSMRYDGKVPESCQLLIGPTYALLREEFRSLREQAKPREGLVRRILIFFGGIDIDNYTSLAIDTVADMRLEHLQVDVVIGFQHPHREEIEAACALYSFACHVQTDRIGELMMAADLAIGASGSAAWERCCVGLPTLIIALSKNQIAIAEGLASVGACAYLGQAHELSRQKLQTSLEQLIFDKKRIVSISERSFSLVDALGADRLCEELLV